MSNLVYSHNNLEKKKKKIKTPQKLKPPKEKTRKKKKLARDTSNASLPHGNITTTTGPLSTYKT
ncbi:hypothetical protein QG37_00011 [Candidozyma auris]|nr:hypothetical protein QG37_00011 [[Candida] auris]